MKRLFRVPSRVFLFLGSLLLLLRLAAAAPLPQDEPEALPDSGVAEEAPAAGPVLWATYQGVIGTISASYLEDAVA